MATGPLTSKQAAPHAVLPQHDRPSGIQLPFLVSTSTVGYLVGLSRAQIYKLIKRGEFPAPVKISTQKVAFVLSEVEAWIAMRTNARDGAV
jgi:prophage regulatory protein